MKVAEKAKTDFLNQKDDTLFLPYLKNNNSRKRKLTEHTSERDWISGLGAMQVVMDKETDEGLSLSILR